jgi:hypothetical protein
MTKYNIEGGIDFYAELYKSLDIEENLEEDKNICLITNQPLTDKHIIMSCGHKFNYIAIYKDIINHKQKFNKMEGGNGRLNTNQIRCPYCRKKQDTLLPYYEELGLAKVNGVNFYDPTVEQTSNHYNKGNKCAYKFPNENYDPNKPESETNSKYKNISCCHYNATTIKVYDSSNPENHITYGDTACYCYSHKKLMIKFYKAQEKQKSKDLAKAAKQKAKEEAKAAKELEKQKIKEEKQKMKETIKKKTFTENIVIGPSNISLLENGCISILKSGPNKGKQCGCQIKSDTMLCGRHFMPLKI